ncbi:hypothetical protein M885DRAFT_551676 [Pelagophyceae sp. CCMP2097]|nr:hypothetical protein M885DRAFT_551676 [Pelagophyceae sp. CCMP2097]
MGLRGAHRLLDGDDDDGSDGISFQVNTGHFAGDQIFLYGCVFVMVMLSACFSGLTLGLLGLDKVGLEIVIGGGSDVDKKYARKVMTVRSDGNRLLCTLLLGNVAVNALLSITLSQISSSITGFLASTALIVIFGEILPQAACSRYALYVGATTLPIVRFFLIVLGPIAVPLGWGLDRLLGDDVGTVHSRKEIMQYMKVHVMAGELDDESGNVMRGALEMKDKIVVKVMTPLEDVYMLPESTQLSFKVVREIFEQGFSRVPVFKGDRANIVGLLFVKDLIFVDPEDETPLSQLLSIFHRGIQIVDDEDTLDDVLRVFKRGHGHLALVAHVERVERKKTLEIEADAIIEAARADGAADEAAAELRATDAAPKSAGHVYPVRRPPTPGGSAENLFEPPREGEYEAEANFSLPLSEDCDYDAARHIIGIVTLEDIVEEIIGDEIIDETDVFVDVDNHIKVVGRSDFDFTRLRRLDAAYVDERLSKAEVDAITAHLLTNVSALKTQPQDDAADGVELRDMQAMLTREEMAVLVRRSRVVEQKRVTKSAHAETIVDADFIYRRNAPAAFATLVLNGKLTITAGRDGFRAEAGPWSVLGADALVADEGEFCPDFSAHIATETVRCVYVSRSEYARAAHMAKLKRAPPAVKRAKRELQRQASMGAPPKRKESRDTMAERRRRLAAETGDLRRGAFNKDKVAKLLDDRAHRARKAATDDEGERRADRNSRARFAASALPHNMTNSDMDSENDIHDERPNPTRSLFLPTDRANMTDDELQTGGSAPPSEYGDDDERNGGYDHSVSYDGGGGDDGGGGYDHAVGYGGGGGGYADRGDDHDSNGELADARETEDEALLRHAPRPHSAMRQRSFSDPTREARDDD